MGGASTYILQCNSNLEAYDLANKIINNCVKDYDPQRVSFFSKNIKSIIHYKNSFKKIHELEIHGFINMINLKKLKTKDLKLSKLLIYPKEKGNGNISWSISLSDEGYMILAEFSPKCSTRNELKKLLLYLLRKNIIALQEKEIEKVLNKCVVDARAAERAWKSDKFEIGAFIFGQEKNVATGYAITQKGSSGSLFQALECLVKLFELQNKDFEINLASDFETAVKIGDSDLINAAQIRLVASMADKDLVELTKKQHGTDLIEISWPQVNWLKSVGDTSYSSMRIKLSNKQLIIAINFHRDVKLVLEHIERTTNKKFEYSKELSG